ncbi:MAG: peptidoglycan-binding protein, partial [Actinomycetota bacterium]
EQLQQSLVRLGYDPGTVNGIYGTQTASAVEDLYRDRGYPAPEPDPGVQSAVDGAEAEVTINETTLADARATLAEAGSTVTDVERQQLDLAIDQAKAGLTATQAAAAQAKAEAEQAVTDAQQQLADATASGDEAAIAEAQAAVTAAESARGLTATEQDLAVRAAELAISEAEQAKAARLEPPDLTQLQTAVNDATEALAEARASLADAQAEAGAWIPTAEVLFLTTTPRQVASLIVEVGDIPTDTVMTISGAETLIDSGVSTADRSLIEVGAQAVLEDDDLGLSIDAVVSFVADRPGGPNLSDDRFAVRLEPVGEIPEDALGLNLRISIPITSSGGDVLAVPLAALSAGADGTARVEIERSTGETELVEVSTGLRADGFVAVEPLGGADLAAGDRVVVGRDLQLPTGDDADTEDTDDGTADDEDDG